MIKDISAGLNDDGLKQLKEVIDRFKFINDEIKLRDQDKRTLKQNVEKIEQLSDFVQRDEIKEIKRIS